MPNKTKSPAANDTWLTPKAYFEKLHDRFKFDEFDPCPPNNDIEEYNGLTIDWDDRVFVNPPYSQKLKEQFLYKGYGESLLGKMSVFLIPTSTSTKIFHELILPNARIEFLRGRLAFEGIDSEGNWCNPNTGFWRLPEELIPEGARQVTRMGQSDLMLVIFGEE